MGALDRPIAPSFPLHVPRVLVVAGPNVGASFDVSAGAVFGRSAVCDVVLFDRRVSRRHAQIRRKGDAYELVDLGSRNGTFVNEVRMDGAVALRSEMRFRVGGSTFAFDPRRLLEVTRLTAGETWSPVPRGFDGQEERLRAAVVSWAGARTPSAVLRLGLGAGIRAIEGARGCVIDLAKDPPAVLVQEGSGDMRIAASMIEEMRAGRACGNGALLGVPLGRRELGWLVELPAVNRRSEELALLAAIADLCGAYWEGSRGRLTVVLDSALDWWERAAERFGPALRRLHECILAAALQQGPVLFFGERSTGRLYLAHLLHRFGRLGNPFEAPRSWQVAQVGWRHFLDGAEGGTLYLGDLAELYEANGLLAALAEEAAERGAPDPRLPARVRLVAAASLPLDELIRERRLPLALAERFAGGVIQTVPLRELGADLPALIEHMLPGAARRVGRPTPRLERVAMSELERYGWPGNLAELAACLSCLALAASGGTAGWEDLPIHVRAGAGATVGSRPLADAVATLERQAISAALRAANGRKFHAARALGISRPTLDKKIARYQIRVR